MSKIEKEFVIQQYYKATVDESAIDESDEYSHRWHRMFKAITADKKALHSVLEYQSLVSHGSNCGDGSEELLNDHYGKKDLEFAHVLAQFAHIFSQEDSKWLLELVKEYAEVEAKLTRGMNSEDYERIGYFDLCLQTGMLQDCFEVEASRWHISELTPCNCEKQH